MEILQNTLIQLVCRKGSDSDRKLIILKSGEPAFTTDTYRLYIGTGNLSGGVVAGNKFQGSNIDITQCAPAVEGDTCVDLNTNTLNVLTSGDGTSLSSWNPIANLTNPVYVKYDGNTQTTEFSRNLTSSYRLSAGHYRFTYNTLPTSYLIPTTEIFGLTPLGYQARTIQISNSACDVVVLSSNGAKTDAIVTLLINY